MPTPTQPTHPAAFNLQVVVKFNARIIAMPAAVNLTCYALSRHKSLQNGLQHMVGGLDKPF